MKNYLGWTAAMVLAVGTLTGCGGGTEAYCDSIKEAEGEFDAFATGDAANFGDAVDKLRDIGGDAPDEVSDDGRSSPARWMTWSRLSTTPG